LALSINTNVSALTVQPNLSKTQGALSQAMTRLSTGLKINSGADGPAALAISEQQRSQIAGLNASLQATNQSVAAVQTGEGALNDVSSQLKRIRGLILDSANSGVNDSTALAANQAEIDQAVKTVNQIMAATEFSGRKLFDGSTTIGSGTGGPTLVLPAVNSSTLGTPTDAATTSSDTQSSANTTGGGVNSTPTDAATTSSDTQSLASITSGGANSVTSGGATTALEIVDRAISQVSSLRGEMGAFQANTLQSSAENLAASLSNVTAAESTNRDSDFATEAANLTRSQVLTQAGTAALSQANRNAELVVGLLRM
jgi:flagellin